MSSECSKMSSGFSRRRVESQDVEWILKTSSLFSRHRVNSQDVEYIRYIYKNTFAFHSFLKNKMHVYFGGKHEPVFNSIFSIWLSLDIDALSI